MKAKKLNIYKPVIGFSLDGEYYVTFFRMSDCEKPHYSKLGFKHQGICACCKGRQKTYKGFKWYYIKDYLGSDYNEEKEITEELFKELQEEFKDFLD